MQKFYNREPWNLIIGLGFFATILLTIALLTSLWTLLIPVLLVMFSYLRFRLKRAIQLWRKGYFSGRRVRDNWIYEELLEKQCVSLVLQLEYTEPGHHEIFIPYETQWRESVPHWARDRRDEISRRIAEAWDSKDFHYPTDFKIS
ncbi:MAG: hypothetical protein ACXWJK_11595 [Burkholderiaceae bacterium]